MTVTLCCAFAPTAATPDHIAVAERLRQQLEREFLAGLPVHRRPRPRLV